MIGVAAPFSPAPPCRLLQRSKTAAPPAIVVPPAALPLRPPAAAGHPSPPCICRARRRVRYDGGDEEEEDQGHNAELSMVESFSVSARGQAFLLQATVDGEEETVLVFRGFSSLLSSGTSPDPSRSVLPARAVVRSIDVVRGPFDPTNVEYLERGIPWEDFKARLKG